MYESLFAALEDAEVRYVVVGGLAVVLHGHARLTVDVDLAIDLDRRETRKALEALSGLGLAPRIPVDPLEFADPDRRREWARDRQMRVFSMVDRDNPMLVVDLFVENPIPFQELWDRSVLLPLRETEVRVASIPDLIHLKRLSDRPQDRNDIEQLEAILRETGEAGADGDRDDD